MPIIDVTGTRGSIEVDNARIYLESLGHNNHTWRTGSTYNSILAQHDHWLWPALQALAEQYGGQGRRGRAGVPAESRFLDEPDGDDPRQPGHPAARLEPGVAAGGDELVLHRATGGDLAQRPRCQDFPSVCTDGAWISSTACMS